METQESNIQTRPEAKAAAQGGDTGKKKVISAMDASVGYEGKPLFSPASFEIYAGECILLCGANGSGKSTLLKAIAGIRPLLGGHICISRTPPMIPSGIPKTEGFTLRSFIRTGCYSISDWAGHLSPDAEKAVDEAMESLGISHLAGRDISRLSDGEFQKGCIASALARKSPLVLLDEPTAFLDAENKISVLAAMIRTAARTGTAFLFSSHDIRDAAPLCSRVFAIGADGVFRSGGPSVEEKNKTILTIFRNKSIIFED